MLACTFGDLLVQMRPWEHLCHHSTQIKAVSRNPRRSGGLRNDLLASPRHREARTEASWSEPGNEFAEDSLLRRLSGRKVALGLFTRLPDGVFSRAARGTTDHRVFAAIFAVSAITSCYTAAPAENTQMPFVC